MPVHCPVSTSRSFGGRGHLSTSASFALLWGMPSRCEDHELKPDCDLGQLGNFCTFIFLSVNCRWNTTNAIGLLWSIIGLITYHIRRCARSIVKCRVRIYYYHWMVSVSTDMPCDPTRHPCELPSFPVRLTGEVTGDSGAQKRRPVCLLCFRLWNQNPEVTGSSLR